MSISVASRGGRSARSRSAVSGRSARSASGGSARGYARLASGKTSAEVALRILDREEAFGGGVFEGAARIDARNANRRGASDRSGFTALAGIDLTDVFDHPDLHRDDFQLFAGFFADGLFAATAITGQFMLG